MPSTSVAKLRRIDKPALIAGGRATLACWLRYKPTVDAAMALHPRPYVFSPSSLSVQTVTSRIRDAIKGCIAFGHESSSPGYTERLLSWWGEVVVRPHGDTVVIGPPSQKLSALEFNGTDNGSTNALSFDSLTFEEIESFCILLNGNRINGPVIVRTLPDLYLLRSFPNVELMPQEDGGLVLL